MKTVAFNPKTIIATTIVAALAIMVTGAQFVQAALQKASAQGESLRVSEVNSCAPSEDGERPNFSGCNSLL